MQPKKSRYRTCLFSCFLWGLAISSNGLGHGDSCAIKCCLLLNITAFTSIMDRYYLCPAITCFSDVSVVLLWYSFMSGALSWPWDLALQCNLGHGGPISAGDPPPCASQLPSVQTNYLPVLDTYYMYPTLL